MRCSTPAAAVAALGFASAHAVGSELENRITASDGLVAYSVPMVDGVEGPCCYAIPGNTVTRKGCNLDGRGLSVVTDDEDRRAALETPIELRLRQDRASDL